MKKALVCVSFGTTVPAARQEITAVEAVLAAAAPGWDFSRAFTSSIIRRVLAARGEGVDSLPEALERLRAAGYEDVAVQPTHFLYGVEYDKMKEQALAAAPGFARLRLGAPLLAGNDDMQALGRAVSALYPAAPGQAVVLMGHGSARFANTVYPAMQTVFALMGRPDVRVGTAEGWPGLDEVRAALRQSGVRSVRLAPMMLVAGDHAWNDMAGAEPDSWRSILGQDGYAVECSLRGLGSVASVQEIYMAHLRDLLAE